MRMIVRMILFVLGGRVLLVEILMLHVHAGILWWDIEVYVYTQVHTRMFAICDEILLEYLARR